MTSRHAIVAHRQERQRQAFTLIELLLAVAIFAVVLVAIQSVFHTALRLRNRTVESIERSLPLRQTLEILRTDLTAIVPPGGTFGGAVESNPSTESLPTTGTPLVQFNAAVGVISDDQPWGEIQRIAYLLAPPTNNLSQGFDLVRTVTRNLLPVSVEETESRRLMSGLQNVTFWFHDGTGWQETWDGTNEVIALPTAIKAEFELAPPPDSRSPVRLPPIELVVGLMLQPAPTNTTDSTTTTTDTGGGG